jgi:hypothetical protein
MKTALARRALVLLLLAGCTSPHPLPTAVLTEVPGLQIERAQSWRAWLKNETGRGVMVEVWAVSLAETFERDLEAEFDGAARVCAALAASDALRDWDYVDLHFSLKYPHVAGATRPLHGNCRVVVRCEALRELRDRGAPPPDYAAHWRVVAAYKDLPDSKTALVL